MGMKINGWNEGLIAYVLAASSPTNAIDKVVYDEGWANNGGMKNGKVYYDYVLPLGTDNGGPLSFPNILSWELTRKVCRTHMPIMRNKPGTMH